jgi:2-keto-myo-inositol isomerase
MSFSINRRTWLAAVSAGAAATSTGTAHATTLADDKSPFKFCLNGATIRGQNLKIVAELDIAAKAGYDGFEPWVDRIDQYVKEGGSLKDLGKRARDSGVSIEDAIGFAQWIVDDADRRRKGLEDAKRIMGMLQELACTRLAAPPAGANDARTAAIPVLTMAERYGALCKLGEEMGITPLAEHWGHSKNLSRLGEAVLVALESGHRNASVLPDVYHLYKGGSEFAGIKLLGQATAGIFHMNDYPAEPPRAQIRDEHRVYPGDGVAPLRELLADLRAIGFRGMLSLELFNREYWKQDPLEVAKAGLAKMKAVANLV